jgi:hypothetical protein
LRISDTQNMLLPIELNGIYTHHKHVKVVYHINNACNRVVYWKLSSGEFVDRGASVVVNLSFESILSRSRFIRFCRVLYFEFIGMYQMNIIVKIMIVD